MPPLRESPIAYDFSRAVHHALMRRRPNGADPLLAADSSTLTAFLNDLNLHEFEPLLADYAFIALALIHERRLGDQSEFAPWLNACPSLLPAAGFADLPLLWSEKELTELAGATTAGAAERSAQQSCAKAAWTMAVSHGPRPASAMGSSAKRFHTKRASASSSDGGAALAEAIASSREFGRGGERRLSARRC